jgi:hypothetical protein
MPAEFTNSRLVGRSGWNSGWKLVILEYSLPNNEQAGWDNFLEASRISACFCATIPIAEINEVGVMHPLDTMAAM